MLCKSLARNGALAGGVGTCLTVAGVTAPIVVVTVCALLALPLWILWPVIAGCACIVIVGMAILCISYFADATVSFDEWLCRLSDQRKYPDKMEVGIFLHEVMDESSDHAIKNLLRTLVNLVNGKKESVIGPKDALNNCWNITFGDLRNASGSYSASWRENWKFVDYGVIPRNLVFALLKLIPNSCTLVHDLNGGNYYLRPFATEWLETNQFALLHEEDYVIFNREKGDNDVFNQYVETARKALDVNHIFGEKIDGPLRLEEDSRSVSSSECNPQSLSEPSSQLSFLPLSQRGFRRSQSLSNLESISKSQWNPLL
ncbi:MAG: hypothetical protein LBT98_00180, partial [Puniceicoccales bacterium]|nr:hypothetical protein [Puniceicoccales bacterium]